jgi:predicted glycoside hydrolase/deacetylase ChbG (UPF0249 family)
LWKWTILLLLAEEPVKIIINCDDLGASSQVNESILDLMGQGRVTSATLMMNAPAVEDAVRQIGKYPQCSFGVHLNVTEFSPLSAHPGLGSLLDEKGEFAGNSRPRPIDFPLSAVIREGVYAEWCAQVERALALGVPISHLDSHHHVHTRAGLWGTLKKLQRRFGIRKVRLRRNVLGASPSVRNRLSLARQFPWNFALRQCFATQTTNGFAPFSVFHARLKAGKRWQGPIELMCHPGRERFAAETELLRGPWKDELAPDAELISYNEL